MNLQDWIGRSESSEDEVTAAQVGMMSATLDWPTARPPAGTPLPTLWHWMYFLPTAPQAEIGPDGHPMRGGFLPPVPLPRRMWAGMQMRFNEPIRVGDRLSRTSTIVEVSEKSGRTGNLVFVKLRHDLRRNGSSDVALSESLDLVYRDAAKPGDAPAAPKAAPVASTWERRIQPSEAMLFRYSALTFNAHRIHYDQPYVTGVEGYPGLVVHGPLIATLLTDLLRRQMPDAQVMSFDFRAIRPTIATHAFCVCGEPQPDGRTVKLWGRDHEGFVTMEATAEVAQGGAGR